MKPDTYLRALRTLDPAPRSAPDGESRRRYETGLQQILATDPSAGAGATAERIESAPHGKHRHARWIAVPAVVAVLAAAVVLAPNLLSAENAYASWTPVPETLTEADLATTEKACREQGLNIDSPSLDIAERRGEWVVLLYAGANDTSADCLAHVPVGSGRADDVATSGSGGKGAVPVGDQFTQGPITEYNDRRTLISRPRPTVSLTQGHIGDNVVGVTIHTADGQQVQASLEDGRYVAWWPGTAFGSELEGNGGPAPDLAYTITLRDGTVLHDAEPTSP
ncbi:hypothetical protein [Arthrobacter sp. zg-Y238]|uniref:hypothetical protein n=1 Tax=Arthrobacter sp. zg-Y238 TaxID=2964614 RepID=UPI0021026D1E|nr:hypothetical protein [Arthrobacter sp. zg-Y238]MCQ1953668.1 hypothetical protein [Arthrobacter sp. zg-Y238]